MAWPAKTLVRLRCEKTVGEVATRGWGSGEVEGSWRRKRTCGWRRESRRVPARTGGRTTPHLIRIPKRYDTIVGRASSRTPMKFGAELGAAQTAARVNTKTLSVSSSRCTEVTAIGKGRDYNAGWMMCQYEIPRRCNCFEGYWTIDGATEWPIVRLTHSLHP